MLGSRLRGEDDRKRDGGTALRKQEANLLWLPSKKDFRNGKTDVACLLFVEQILHSLTNLSPLILLSPMRKYFYKVKGLTSFYND